MPPIRRIYKDEYPALLLQLHKIPRYLDIIGQFPPDSYSWLCVVGSRTNSSYGSEVCKMLIEGLRGHPIVIVSGLAVGIDSLAHEMALRAGLKTVAIPGSGLSEKVLYPVSRQELAKKIVSSGGAIVSPFNANQEATKWTFPVRNQLMAGLSHAILIIEARKKSGTLITASFASKINRDVLAVPGSVFSDLSQGPHHLIRDGATTVTSSQDILEALGFKVKEDEFESRGSNSISDRLTKVLTNPSLSPEEITLIKLLEAPRIRDDLMRKMNISAAQLNILITQLELKDIIVDRDGQIFIT